MSALSPSLNRCPLCCPFDHHLCSSSPCPPSKCHRRVFHVPTVNHSRACDFKSCKEVLLLNEHKARRQGVGLATSPQPYPGGGKPLYTPQIYLGGKLRQQCGVLSGQSTVECPPPGNAIAVNDSQYHSVRTDAFECLVHASTRRYPAVRRSTPAEPH